MTDSIYQEINVPLFEAIYGKGLISLGGYEAVDDMFAGKALSGKQLLDIGSGIGGMAYHLVKHYNCHVIGLEVPVWMAQYASKHAPKAIRKQVQFISYDADGTIPITAESIDLCYSKGVLTNVADKLTLFQQISQLLKPNGEVLLVDWLVPEAKGPSAEKLRLGDMSFKESQSSYAQILHDANFKDVTFVDKSAAYLQYAKQLDEMYHDREHQKRYADIISQTLRQQLIKANDDLIESIEKTKQLSMLISATKAT